MRPIDRYGRTVPTARESAWFRLLVRTTFWPLLYAYCPGPVPLSTIHGRPDLQPGHDRP